MKSEIFGKTPIVHGRIAKSDEQTNAKFMFLFDK